MKGKSERKEVMLDDGVLAIPHALLLGEVNLKRAGGILSVPRNTSGSALQDIPPTTMLDFTCLAQESKPSTKKEKVSRNRSEGSSRRAGSYSFDGVNSTKGVEEDRNSQMEGKADFAVPSSARVVLSPHDCSRHSAHSPDTRSLSFTAPFDNSKGINERALKQESAEELSPNGSVDASHIPKLNTTFSKSATPLASNLKTNGCRAELRVPALVPLSCQVDNIGLPQALHSTWRQQAPQSSLCSNVSMRDQNALCASFPETGSLTDVYSEDVPPSNSHRSTRGNSPSRERGKKRLHHISNRTTENEGGSVISSSLDGRADTQLFLKKVSRGGEKTPTLTPTNAPSLEHAMENGGLNESLTQRQSIRVSLAHKALIGKGSYGMVFQAMDLDTNRIIAVKEISLRGNAPCPSSRPLVASNAKNSPSDASAMGSSGGGVLTPATTSSPNKSPQDASYQQRLELVRRELGMMRQLDHPNIVKFLGEECDESYLRIYMEYVACGSVSSLLRTFGSFQERQASNFTRQMLQGLAYLHSKNIAHHDLKGDNLLVDPDGTLKLADFGTARDMHAAGNDIAIGGTAYFLAPEVVTDMVWDFKSDIWSAGCCVIEMLTGSAPLSHMTNQYSVMLMLANSKGELVDQYIPAVHNWSPEVIDFLTLCLQRDPSKRPTPSQLLSHRWITNPTQDDNICSPASTVQTTATLYLPLPSPPPLTEMPARRSEVSKTLPGSSECNSADIACSNATARFYKKSGARRRDGSKKKKRGSGGGEVSDHTTEMNSPRDVCWGWGDPALQCPHSVGEMNDSSTGGTSLLSPPWTRRVLKHSSKRHTACVGGEADDASNEPSSPFLPILTGVSTPTVLPLLSPHSNSWDAPNKSLLSSAPMRTGFAETLLSTKSSFRLCRSPVSSDRKDTEAYFHGRQPHQQNRLFEEGSPSVRRDEALGFPHGKKKSKKKSSDLSLHFKK